MNLKKCVIASITLTAVLTVEASANVFQFQCSNFVGQRYDAAENLNALGSSEWSEDTMREGIYVIDYDVDAHSFDLNIRDASGAWFRPTEEGSNLIAQLSDPEDGSLMFTVLYTDGSVEIDLITGVFTDKPQLISTYVRNGPLITGSRIIVGDCQPVTRVR